ncbi:unnamed protein product [Chironomus riparius]|uniref:Uncharacterized protein n=1 Tax=Chironomus riparius TaxID=315576 RepID=A0A9N9RL38_9DIPT|nr:unnamed protein product [Chironomus riparius]
MQAALMLRSKQRIARNKLRRQRLGGRNEIPSHIAPPCLEIPPFPQYPPTQAEFAHIKIKQYMIHISYMCGLTI